MPRSPLDRAEARAWTVFANDVVMPNGYKTQWMLARDVPDEAETSKRDAPRAPRSINGESHETEKAATSVGGAAFVLLGLIARGSRASAIYVAAGAAGASALGAFGAFAALAGFFSSAGASTTFSLFSTSSRIDIGALSPTRFEVWIIRV